MSAGDISLASKVGVDEILADVVTTASRLVTIGPEDLGGDRSPGKPRELPLELRRLPSDFVDDVDLTRCKLSPRISMGWAGDDDDATDDPGIGESDRLLPPFLSGEGPRSLCLLSSTCARISAYVILDEPGVDLTRSRVDSSPSSFTDVDDDADVNVDAPDGKGDPGSLFRGPAPQPHFFIVSLAVALSACLSLAFQDASRALAVDCVAEMDVDGAAAPVNEDDEDGLAPLRFWSHDAEVLPSNGFGEGLCMEGERRRGTVRGTGGEESGPFTSNTGVEPEDDDDDDDDKGKSY